MDISLESYRIFVAVVKAKSMSQAAKELYISQPAVSMALSKLETQYGNKLLIRNAKGVHPTQEGLVLYQSLEKAFDIINQAQTNYFKLKNLDMGQIRIGASDTLSSQFLLPHLEKYHNAFQNINIMVTNRPTPDTIKLLKAEEVDIGFVNLPIEDDKDLIIEPCLTIHDCLLGGSKFKELAKCGININQLNEYPLIMLEQDSNSRLYIDQYAHQHNVKLIPNIALGSSDLLVKFTKINLGISFAIREFYQEQINDIDLFEIPLYPEIPSRSIGLIYLKNVPLSTATKKFIKLLKNN